MRSPRIPVTFDEDTMKQLKSISDKNNISIAEVVRRFTIEGLKTQVGADNIDLITNIIREQLKDVLRPEVERICSLTAKTCVMSAASSYLNAEAIGRFVPLENQLDVNEAYDKAKLKAVNYMKSRSSDIE